MTQAVVTARINADLDAKLNALAAQKRRSRSWLTARAVETYVEREAAFLAFVQEGIDDVERGNVVSEEEMDEVFDRMLAELDES